MGHRKLVRHKPKTKTKPKHVAGAATALVFAGHHAIEALAVKAFELATHHVGIVMAIMAFASLGMGTLLRREG